ncbi:MAG: hypothetical protein HY553_14695 [Elusimicrobia bacterium]|nr:hypothetical protein [Elusimicrobiota bacterium]
MTALARLCAWQFPSTGWCQLLDRLVREEDEWEATVVRVKQKRLMVSVLHDCLILADESGAVHSVAFNSVGDGRNREYLDTLDFLPGPTLQVGGLSLPRDWDSAWVIRADMGEENEAERELMVAFDPDNSSRWRLFDVISRERECSALMLEEYEGGFKMEVVEDAEGLGGVLDDLLEQEYAIQDVSGDSKIVPIPEQAEGRLLDIGSAAERVVRLSLLGLTELEACRSRLQAFLRAHTGGRPKARGFRWDI